MPCVLARKVSGLLLAAAGAAGIGQQESITIQRSSSGGYQVTSSVTGPLGSDGTIRGAGGAGYMDVARDSGADALRTWGVSNLAEELANASAHGLRVSAGIWLPHSPSVYQSCSGDLNADPFWKSELDRYIAAVRQHKNSPGLLWWTVGNEQEIEVDVFRGNECVWKRLEWAVQAVKAEDPNHPVGTVTAGAMKPKVDMISALCPSLDFLGVNSYGDDSLQVGPSLREWNFNKPYAIMEFGPSGHWVAPLTEWGAYIEERSSEKVPRYNATCYSCYDDPLCLGSFAFVWGWKWEKTGTWYNMFNEWKDVTEGVAVDCPSCQSEVMATLQKCWTGSERPARPPTIKGVQVDGQALPDMSFVVDRRDSVQLRVDASHPLGRALKGVWAATEEVVSTAIGGAWEATNPLLPGLWAAQEANQAVAPTTGSGLSVTLNTSALAVGGEYRLYVFVREDPAGCGKSCQNQEAYASLPFRICQTAQPGEQCYRHVHYALTTGLREHPQTYPGVNASSSFEEVQMLLHQLGSGSCPAPCGGVRAWCYTAAQGEQCHGHVRWIMDEGLAASPGAFPEELQNASFEKVQSYVHGLRDGTCPKPCEESQLRVDLEADPNVPLSSSVRGVVVPSALAAAGLAAAVLAAAAL